MRLKYDQFYFENLIHDYDEFWDLYDKDNVGAWKKYNGKIFCPMCLTAPLAIVSGPEKRYFRVSKSNMNLHAIDCPYRLDEAAKQEVKDFLKNATENDIRSRLQSCMNYLLKKTIHQQKDTTKETREYNKCPIFLTTKTKREKIVYLPHKSLNSQISDSDIGIEKIFYGRCRLYWLKNEQYKYLKIVNDKYKEIFSIKITEPVFTYLSENIKNISNFKATADEYYICIIISLQEKRTENHVYYNGTLIKSNYILINKC